MAVRGRPKNRRGRDLVTPQNRRSTLGPEAEILDDDTAAHELVRLVRDLLPYPSFLILRPPLEYRKYKALRNLCMLEELFHLEDSDICERLRVSQKMVESLRSETHYETMKARVIEVVDKLASPRKLAQWAADNEDNLSLALLKTALWDGSTRDRTQAMNSLLDRVSAKKGRDEESDGELGVPVFPTDMIKMTEMVFSLGVALGRGPGGEISGSRLNVPKLVGSGGTPHNDDE